MAPSIQNNHKKKGNQQKPQIINESARISVYTINDENSPYRDPVVAVYPSKISDAFSLTVTKGKNFGLLAGKIKM